MRLDAEAMVKELGLVDDEDDDARDRDERGRLTQTDNATVNRTIRAAAGR